MVQKFPNVKIIEQQVEEADSVDQELFEVNLNIMNAGSGSRCWTISET